MSERFAGLIDLLSNRQMPDDATPKVTLGDLRALHAAGLAEGRSEREALDLPRVKQAIANIAQRHHVTKDAPLPYALMRIYGYSAAPTEMDAEIAAEYAILAAHPTPPDSIDDTQRAEEGE